MCNFSKKVKNKLFSIISEMDKISWLFVKNPGRDFTRKSPLSFEKMLKLMISMDGQSIHKELYNFMGFKTDTPSASAFVQQRGKIDVFAFEYLFKEFSHAFKSTKMLNGYELLAIDGSDIHTPTNTKDSNSYFQTAPDAKGYNLFHLNALYNLLDKRYVDVIVQPRRKFNEHGALCNMVDRASDRKNVIIIADRGYEGYNTIAHIEQKGWNYLIRVKNNRGIVAQLSLPIEDEFDIDVNLQLTRRQTKEIKDNPDKYRAIMTNMNFDYLPLKSKETYPLNFRLVRMRLSDDTVETIVTNLERDKFSVNTLKKLYKMRWGIETSFRELKYNVGLSNFHSKKADFILQEIYARLIMYNFSMLIAKNVCIQQNNKAYVYQINFAEAIYICKHFFRNKESPQNVEALIARNILPVRPDRKYIRNIRYQSAVSFIYRVA